MRWFELMAVSLVLLTGALILPCSSEVYTSTHQLKQVFMIERNLVDALGKYLAKAETRLGRIRRYIEEYEAVKYDMGLSTPDHGRRSLPNGEAQDRSGSSVEVSGQQQPNTDASMAQLTEDILDLVAGNPLHTFHLMKRLTVYWKHIDSLVVHDEWQGVLQALFGEGGRQAPSNTLPGDDDLQGAAQALVRLRNVYGFNLTSLIHGEMWGVQSAAGLTAQDCLYMGKHSYNLGYYGQSVEWFEHAYSLAGNERNQTITQEQVVQFLNAAIKTQEELQANQRREELKQVQQFSIPATDDTENLSSFTENVTNNYERGTKSYFPDDYFVYDPYDGLYYHAPQYDETNFFALCRGDKIMPYEEEAKLHCKFDDRGSPYLKLMPAKVELHHLSGANLMSFHDVISDEEIEALKRMANPVLSRAMVQGVKGKGNTVSNTRTSKVAWLDDTKDPLVARLSRRIQDLTGLSTDTMKEHAEMLQVANYGVGGHYNPHHDYLLVDKTPQELANINYRELIMGDRVATFMFYLNDVVRGGATAFPRLGTAVWPSKGSAAFWYNLRRSGRANEYTLHGGCPVVIGSKWVSNKWIRERGQIHHHLCGLKDWQ